MFAALAPLASFGSMALGAASALESSEGAAAGQEFMAAKAEKAAAYARLQAEQTDVHAREELNTVIGMIGTMRAAANIDPSSPTTAAIDAKESKISDRNRISQVNSLKAQAADSEYEASVRNSLAGSIRTAGYFTAGAKLLGGLGGLWRGMMNG
jgi:hypothetical protein